MRQIPVVASELKRKEATAGMEETRQPARRIDIEVDPPEIKKICPSNCGIRTPEITMETWRGLWSFDLVGIPRFMSAYKNTLEMINWLALCDEQKAVPFGKIAISDLEEVLRQARGKLVYEAEREDIPDSYERATTEGIQRLEAIRDELAVLASKAEVGSEIANEEIYSVLERLHQHVVNPPAWTKYKSD